MGFLAPKPPKAPAPIERTDAADAAKAERMRQTRLRGLSGNILTSENQPAGGTVATKILLGQ